MPPPYQVSFYGRFVVSPAFLGQLCDRYDEERKREMDTKEDRRERDNPYSLVPLEGDPLVLVNFNKIDKIDFDTLQVWSQVSKGDAISLPLSRHPPDHDSLPEIQLLAPKRKHL
jgi:hypothetical protein